MKVLSLVAVGALSGLLVVACGCRETDTETAAPAIGEAAPVEQAAEQARSAKSPDTVLVTVNGKSLTSGMAESLARQMAARQGVPAEMVDNFLAQAGSKVEEQTVHQFINQTLIEGAVARSEISVSGEEIDVVLTRLTNSLPAGVTLDEALAEQGMAMEQLREEIGKTERFRKLYEAETTLREPVTDAQVKTFYEENAERFSTSESAEASHILIACDEGADEAAHAKAKAEAEAVRQRLVDGADFAEVAAETSACPSKEKGGSLGSFERGRMAPEFEAAAFAQPVGDFGPVIKTKFGYHIVLVTGRKEAGVLTFEEVQDDIREYLTGQAKEALFDTYIESLRGQAKIEFGERK